MRPLSVLLVLYMSNFGIAAGFDPFKGPKPLVVFMQTNPWLHVISSDSPSAAIYENGDVIYAKRSNEITTYYHVRLAEKELENLLQKVRPVLQLKKLESGYDLDPGLSDQPAALFYFRNGYREFTTAVYGLMCGGKRNRRLNAQATIPPIELLRLHRTLCNIHLPNAKEWTPKYVEVMMHKASIHGESIPWPKDWPSLDSDRAIKRGDDHSIFIDGEKLRLVHELLADKKYIEIDGKTVNASYRLTFPSEPIWQKAFNKSE